MKQRFFAFILFLLYPCYPIAFSQTVDDIGKIIIGVKIGSEASEETFENKDILEKRLIQYITQSGYSSLRNSTFFLSPNIVIENTEIAEGGMKNIYVVRGTLHMSIQDCIDGTIYSSMELTFRGSATEKNKAIRNAIIALNFRNTAIFLEKAKSKILSFYKQRKENLFNQADFCASREKYDEAIARLMMVPEELTDLYSEALKKAQAIYDRREKCIKQNYLQQREISNNQVLIQAKNLLAMHKPQDALEELYHFQSGNKIQDSIYNQLLTQAEQQVSADEQRAFQKEERDYQDKIKREEREWEEYQKETEHRRNIDNLQIASNERILHHQMNIDEQKINAIKTVACEYIKNNPRVFYIY